VGQVEVQEDGRDDRRIGQKRENPHLGAAGGTQERQYVIDAREQDGPADFGQGKRARAPERGADRSQQDLEHRAGDAHVVVEVGT
jgi:hypothetical protein